MGDAKQSAMYKLEYNMEAARVVKGRQAESDIAKVMDILKTSLDNWHSLCSREQPKGTGDKPVQIFSRST